ncbi:unnamed protein product [Alopecurus aequalis]
MASSSSTGEEPPASSVLANAPPQLSTEANMTVATGRDNCQQLKDMLNMEDPSTMSSSSQTSTPIPPSPPPLMDPWLLAVACCSWKKLQSFLNGDPLPTCRSSTIQQPPHDEEALLRVCSLDGVTVEGDTFLHVMATNSVGDDLVEDGLGLIRSKAVQLLFARNKKGDTALHCAARAEEHRMVFFLVDLARGKDADTVKALLETENNSRWTVLNEAVRVGNNDMVKFFLNNDPDLARSPKDGTSPMYLAILLQRKTIAETLYEISGGDLSYSGPNGQNALHAAVLRGKGMVKCTLPISTYRSWFNILFAVYAFRQDT